jgi:intraflagellar transport protein 46
VSLLAPWDQSHALISLFPNLYIYTYIYTEGLLHFYCGVLVALCIVLFSGFTLSFSLVSSAPQAFTLFYQHHHNRRRRTKKKKRKKNKQTNMRRASDETSGSSDYDENTENTEEESHSGSNSPGNLPIPVPSSNKPPHDRAGILSRSNSNNSTSRPVQQLTASQLESAPRPAVEGGQLMSNNPNDERVEVRGAENVATPRASLQPGHADRADIGRVGGNGGMGRVIENSPHDEAIPVSGHVSQVATPMAMRVGGGAMRPNDDDDDDNEEAEEEEGEEEDEGHEHRAEGYAGQKPEEIAETTPVAATAIDPQLGYNPAKYTRINANASRAMQDLFSMITRYEPFAAELPAKLRPFVPDYIPAIGDLDPFVKIPRPDGEQDGLGLYVVDEPTIPQSNPAVVLLELNATNAHGVAAEVVDSLENAANRPEVIDRWISDIKKVHYKKALPTVNYQRPMPDIEKLMQVWPQQFEEVLNSDVAFPPSHIDLDLDQYVRTLCAILDIPTYTSLIDSLHVMFTLYEEFRSNQHFQHA